MQLTIRSGVDAGRTVVVEGSEFTIGRHADCDLVLTDLKVSRHHAAIRSLPDGRTVLYDLGSSNGTYVNGHRVQSILLSGSEQVQVGDTVIVPTVSVPVPGGNGATAVMPGQQGYPPEYPPPPPPPARGPISSDVYRRQTNLEIPTGFAPPESAETRQLPPDGPPPPPQAPRPPSARDRPSTPSGIQRLMLQRSVKRATYIGIAAIVLVVAVAVLGIAGVFNKSSSNNVRSASGPGLRATTAPTAASAVQKVTPSTVLVVEAEGGGNGGRGSGWVWDARRGLIVTNAHVTHGGIIFTIAQGGSIDITTDSAGDLLAAGPTARRAQLKAEALCEDIAVLQVTDTRGLKTIAEMPPGQQLHIGDPVVGVGYPAAAPIAANPDFNATLTGNTGVVSVPRTTLEAVPGTGFETGPYKDVVQTDTVINEGNSGGPLVNLEGQLVGMNTIKSTQNVGQNYAVSAERIRQIVPELLAGKTVC